MINQKTRIFNWITSPMGLVLSITMGCCLILPLLSHGLKISVAHRVVWLFLVINSLANVVIGYYLAKVQAKWWYLFVFPLVFMLSVLLYFAKYNYFLAPAYLLLALIVYLQTRYQ